jgi:acyl-CoA oxidase
MFELSDEIQHTARSYGERIVFERTMNTIENCDESLKSVLTNILICYGLKIINSDLSYFIMNDFISKEISKKVPIMLRKICSTLAKECLSLVDAFDLPNHLVSAPISKDWESFNKYDNKGEVLDFINKY